jgi:hypothetical protein
MRLRGLASTLATFQRDEPPGKCLIWQDQPPIT